MLTKAKTFGMRGLLLGVAFGAQAVCAVAADLGPVNVAPPVAFTWTGFTLGANVGGAWSTIQDNGLGGANASSVMGGVSGRLQLAICAVLGGWHRGRLELGRPHRSRRIG
jgi:hypothetical protein